jgi:hypothetical protein
MYECTPFIVTDQLVRNKVIEQLQHVHDVKDLVDVQVPMELLEHIDKGKNPGGFIKEILDNCIKRNEATRAKIHAIQVTSKWKCATDVHF